MTTDLIDAGTYATHLQRLTAEREVAQTAYDDAALAAATDPGAQSALTAARGRLSDVDASIAALNRARELSEQAEQEAEGERLAAERGDEARKALADRNEASALAAAADEAWENFLAVLGDARAAERRCGAGLRNLLSDRPRERIVGDTLANQFEGALLMGRLRKVGLPGIDLYDDPVGAMREFKGHTLKGHITGRLDKAINLAAADVPELRNVAEDKAA